MKRFRGMNLIRGLPVAAALIAAACGGEQSVASRSAAAYREAQAKGTPAGGGHDHGSHAAAAETAGTAEHGAHGAHGAHATSTGDVAADHAAHGTVAGAHAGMNHGAAGGAMDHSAHGGAGAPDHAAMTPGHAQHGASTSATNAHAAHTSTPAAAHDRHAGMQHAAPSAAAGAHAQHGAQTPAAQVDHSEHGPVPSPATAGADSHAQHGAATPSAPAEAPRSINAMQRVQPAATLRGDAFDAPAAASVSEAAKATHGGSHEGHATRRGITPGQDRENPPTPMPATRDGSAKAPPADHSHHGATKKNND